MLKWMIVFIVGILALTFFLQRLVGDAPSAAPTPRVSAAAPAVAASVAAEPAEGSAAGESQTVAPLPVAKERLSGRVPPTQGKPIQGEILVQ